MRHFTFFLMLICYTINSQISPDLTRLMAKQHSIPVLIQLKEHADLSGIKTSWNKEQKTSYVYNALKTKATISQKEITAYLRLHNIEFTSFYVVNAVLAILNPNQIRDVSMLNSVLKLSHDSYNHAIPHQDKSIHLSQRAPEITWGIQRVGADKVWAKGFEGQGVVVGGNDTGVKWDVPAIKERYRGYTKDSVDHNYNWHDGVHQNSPLSGTDDNPCGLNLRVPCDDNSHGTHTVGTMVGLTDEHAIGMAPKAQWIGCRNMERGNGSPSTYIECFEFFLAPTNLDGLLPRPELAPHVINNSWYCSLAEGCDSSIFPIMELVVENLRAAGIVVVVSAGNDGAVCNTISHVPAIYKNSFTVGAFQIDNTISDFSSNGPVTNYKDIIIKPNVVAPGSDVLSVIPDGSYASWSGTSMAGPHVAGLVALMISANPAIAGHVEQIETIIEETAERFTSDLDCFPFSGSSIPNNTFGYGLINADKAVERALIAVSTENEVKPTLKIYPNPAIDKIHIERQTTETLNLSLKDLFGKTRIEKTFTTKKLSIDISELIPGVYILWNETNKSAYLLIKT